ncbi:MAG: hypothetical protein ACK417_10495 [Bacteroidia bacterium]
MEDKLRLLAEKLVNEGLSKAEEEQQKLLAEARSEAEKILRTAEKEAEKIKQEADKAAKQLRISVQSELQQLSRRALEGIRADIRELIHSRVLRHNIQEAFHQNPTALLKQIIEQLYRDEKGRLQLRMPEATLAAMAEKIEASLHDLLGQKPVLMADAALGAGFSIQVEGNKYVVDFTAADFEMVMQELMSDQLKKLLGDAE